MLCFFFFFFLNKTFMFLSMKNTVKKVSSSPGMRGTKEDFSISQLS